MAKEKSKYAQVMDCFFSGIKLYFKYLDRFLKYLSFPILGQLLGLFLIFSVAYFYTVNLPDLMVKYPVFNNLLVTTSILILLVIVPFLIFTKAFYDYLIAIASLNSMALNLTMKGKGRAKDFDPKMHDELIRRKIFNYLGLLIVLSVIGVVALIPIFWIPAIVFFIYASLCIQVFSLEERLSPYMAIQRSFTLVKHNFWATSILLGLLFLFTYIFLPNLIVWAIDKVDGIYYLTSPFESYVKLLPIDLFNQSIASFNIPFDLEPYEISRFIVTTVISTLIIASTLPIRCAASTLWYKYLDDGIIEENRKQNNVDGRKVVKKIMRTPKKQHNKEKEDDI